MAEMPTQRPPSFSVAPLDFIASPTTSLLITSPELSAVQYTEQYPNWDKKLAIIVSNIWTILMYQNRNHIVTTDRSLGYFNCIFKTA